jgi:hypothetical protein
MTQFVKVDLDGKAYTYKWTGSVPLEPGDQVEVPGNVVNTEPSVRRVLRVLNKPDYEVAKIVAILSKVEPATATEKALDQLDRDEARRMRLEPHDWDDMNDDLIGDYEDINHQQALDEFDAFENYVAEADATARQRSTGGMDPSADNLPEDAARMMQKRYVDALPDDLIGDPDEDRQGFLDGDDEF